MANSAIHIELINIPRDADRLALIAEELRGAGLSATPVPGFDYRTDGGVEAMAPYCKTEGPWGVFQKQDMACTISHMKAWERFLASDAPYCLVLEDDIFISPELGHWLTDLSWWPAGADLVKLERWVSPRLKVALEPHSAHRGREISRLLSRHVGAAGYLMTRRSAELALAARPFDIAVDNLLFNANASRLARRLSTYQVHPAMIQQGNEPDGSPARGATRIRPTGMALLRQKIKRGYYEVVYPLSTIAKLLMGKAQLKQITFAAEVS